MIPMRQFFKGHDLDGEVTESTEGAISLATDGQPYRLRLSAAGRTFETQITRPPGASPDVAQGLAEVARRARAYSESDDGPVAGYPREFVADESRRLRALLGEAGYAELLFEFGRRPEGDLEEGDPVGEPTRPDEMTNQEPEALIEAERSTDLPVALQRSLLVLPGAAGVAASVLLFTTGHRTAAVAAVLAGAGASAAAAATTIIWRRTRQQTAVVDTLGELSDQHASIFNFRPRSRRAL